MEDLDLRTPCGSHSEWVCAVPMVRGFNSVIQSMPFPASGSMKAKLASQRMLGERKTRGELGEVENPEGYFTKAHRTFQNICICWFNFSPWKSSS